MRIEEVDESVSINELAIASGDDVDEWSALAD